MAGLIGMGQALRNQSMAGMDRNSNSEAKRNQANSTLKANFKAAEKSQQGTLAGTGAAVGMMGASAAGMTGMAMLGPVGLGLAGGLVLAELF